MRKSKIKIEANISENLIDQMDILAIDNIFDGSDSNLCLNNNDTNLMDDIFLFQSNNNVSIANNLAEIDEEYLNKLSEQCTFKNPYLKLDNEINWKIEQPNFNKNKNFIKNQNSLSQNHFKMCEEAV